MSDQDQPSKHTSSVPLKKETVRVTLKAADAPSAPAGAAPAPSAPKPSAPMPPTAAAPRPPTAAPVPSAPKPPTAAPVATKPAGAPAPAPAPTIKLNTGAAPSAPGAAPAPAPTIKLATAGASSPSLPKATVQLQPPTQPMGASAPAASQMATMGALDDEEEEEGVDSPVVVGLSILTAVAAAVVLFLQISTAQLWLGHDEDAAPKDVEWSQLF